MPSNQNVQGGGALAGLRCSGDPTPGGLFGSLTVGIVGDRDGGRRARSAAAGSCGPTTGAFPGCGPAKRDRKIYRLLFAGLGPTEVVPLVGFRWSGIGQFFCVTRARAEGGAKKIDPRKVLENASREVIAVSRND